VYIDYSFTIVTSGSWGICVANSLRHISGAILCHHATLAGIAHEHCLCHHHMAGIAVVLVIKVTCDQLLTAIYDHGICRNDRWLKIFWWAQSVKTESSILRTWNNCNQMVTSE